MPSDVPITPPAPQGNLLPRRLPDLSRTQVAVRYQPSMVGAEVGGDWYDVIVHSDAKVTFVIGDVQGHSTAAAGLMGQLRTGVRAYVSEGHSPGAALARTNQLLADLGSDLLATCCLVELDQHTGLARAPVSARLRIFGPAGVGQDHQPVIATAPGKSLCRVASTPWNWSA